MISASVEARDGKQPYAGFPQDRLPADCPWSRNGPEPFAPSVKHLMHELFAFLLMMAAGVWFILLAWVFPKKPSEFLKRLLGPAHPFLILREMQVESEQHYPMVGHILGSFGVLIATVFLGLLISHLIVGHNLFLAN